MSTYAIITFLVLLPNIFHFCDSGVVEDTPSLPTGQHYEQCWRIVENLCEGNRSTGCTDLVKLCGQLLRDHLVEAHLPCAENAPRRVRSSEVVSSEQDPIISSVSLSKQLAHLVTGHKHSRILKKYIMKNNSVASTSVTNSAAEPSTTSTPPTTVSESPEEASPSQQFTEGTTEATSSEDIIPENSEEDGEKTRRTGELRSILPERQAISYANPLEKRTGYSRPAVPQYPPEYVTQLLEYRQSFLEGKEDIMKEWLVNNASAFKVFLQFWKNALVMRLRGYQG